MTDLLVIGNGPSTKTLQFNKIKIDTFCVNNSYKMFKTLQFYPKYFGSFDKRHCKENKQDYIDLIKNSPIEKFFIPKQYLIGYPEEILNHPKLVDMKVKYVKRGNDLKYPKSFLDYTDGGNSGINAVLCGYLLGYKNIYLMGCDASYGKNIIDENDNTEESLNKLNSNYWIDNYYETEEDLQFKPTLRFHKPFWNMLLKRKPKNINIYNCSTLSELKKFPFKEITTIYKK